MAIARSHLMDPTKACGITHCPETVGLRSVKWLKLKNAEMIAIDKLGRPIPSFLAFQPLAV